MSRHYCRSCGKKREEKYIDRYKIFGKNFVVFFFMCIDCSEHFNVLKKSAEADDYKIIL